MARSISQIAARPCSISGPFSEMFEAEQRDNYIQRHIGAAIGGGARLPRVYCPQV